MSTPVQYPPHRHAYSVDDYYRMAEAGILRPDDRVELIEGEIIDMAPIGSRHAAAVKRIAQVLTLALGKQATVSTQDPVRLDRHSEPQPDIAVLKPQADFYAAAHPGPSDVLLIVEVADSTLRFDRDIKLPLYARHGIPEVWLVDIEHAHFTVCNGPGAEGYAWMETPATLTRVVVPGVPDVAVDLSGLF
jgi:Uma2 family endonuclease